MHRRICTNYAKCALAQNHEDFSHEKRSLTHCPLCDKRLSEVVPPSRSIAGSVGFGFALVATVVLVLIFAAAVGKKWISASQGATAAELKDAPKAILRLADSNTIQDSLGPALAEAFLKAQGATNVQILPGTDSQERTVQGVLPGDELPSAITVAAHGSATAVTALAGDVWDIGMSSRKLKPDEAGKRAASGDSHSAPSEHVLGLDGIAVIVNASNPLKELRKDTIKQIFTGKITDWSMVGSMHGRIQVYARDEQSGIADSFKAMVLAGAPVASSARRFQDSLALSQEVSSDPNGIGFVSLPLVHSAKSIAIADRGADALKPTRLTVATEEYPLSRRLYLYTPSTPHNAFTQKFVEFALSSQGQEVVAANGFVAQTVARETQPVSDLAPDEYQELTRNAERLSLDFRFINGDLDLDNKAQQDLDRVVSLLADQGGAKKQILLFGFTDDTGGTAEEDQAVSLSRARIVEKLLIQRGVKPAVVEGFGTALPVAPNDTTEGREKNRRVEVWIQK
jgi:phosphate transport system substrate-binding protein